METSETYLFRYISLQIRALKLTGLYFFISHDLKSYTFWIIVLSRLVYGVFIFVLPIMGQFLYFVRLIMSGTAEVQEAAGVINLVLIELLIFLIYLDSTYRRNLLLELKKQMRRKEFLHFSLPQKTLVDRSIKLSKKFFFAFVISATVDTTVHMIVVPGLKKFAVLPVKMDFIFFDPNGQYFNFLCVYQILYKPVILAVFSSLQSMRWSFMLCTISQLDVLIYNFENMKELVKAGKCEINEAFKDGFKKSIVHHCAIIKFVDTIGRTFGAQFLLAFLISSIVICTTAVQFFSIRNPLNNIVELVWVFGFLFILTIMLYVDCYFGSIITEKGSYMSTIVYCFPWIDLPQQMKKNFIIFLIGNQQDLVLKTSKLLPVSMATFRKVMNWTYKGFAVLNQMKK
ncbi:odorant receptor 23a-like [Maniola jurtina]|uniref:odorant receptor 23a-like n=1 Tax=Maniola jurtina TaxID=191418 RepID=UPI001E68A596|nr:odorant receptor 23a-like [Maniola jurtina]